MINKNNQVRFSCSDELLSQLKLIASQSSHKTMSKFICQTLEDHFKGIRPTQPVSAEQQPETIIKESDKPIVIIIR